MLNLLGEHACKLDAKSRIALPAALLKQLSAAAKERFVVNRGIEQHLVIYPGPAWDSITEKVNQLNEFMVDHRRFFRRFYGGATPLTLDSQNRLLLPKRLLEYAAIKDQVILFAHGEQIEVWAAEHYQKQIDMDADEFAALAERVMGNKDPQLPQ